VDILILADARPGHFRQSEGLAAAIGRRRRVTVRTIAVTPHPVWKGTLLRLMVRTRLPARMLLRLAFRLDATALGRPALIVSAGSDTLPANVLAARLTGAPNVFIGTIRDFAETDFAAVLTTFPREAHRPRHVLTLKPTLVDPDRLPAPRPISSPDELAGASLAVLVGGPTPSHRWSAGDWAALSAVLTGLVDRFGVRLRITTSRRTPAAAVEALKDLSRGGSVETLTIFGEASAGSLDPFFGADAILVTDDSATMVFEAVSARRPVVTLAPADRRPTRDDAAFAHLAAGRLIRRLDTVAATPQAVAEALASVRPQLRHPGDVVLDAAAPALVAAGIELAGTPQPVR
jgi:mitochondrial fission protein ELM1